MSALWFNTAPAWAVGLDLAAHLAVGILAGALYFRGLWWNAQWFAAGGRKAITIVVMLGRFLLLGGLLILVSQEGALPLLAVALGVFVARFIVVRRLRNAIP